MRIAEVFKSAFDRMGGRYFLDRIDEASCNVTEKRGMLYKAFLFALINKVPGDYLEFGVYRGDSFLMAHRMKRRFRLEQMKLWGFDSFEGLPEIDDAKDNAWREGQYACSIEELRRILASNGVRQHEYELVPGYYHRSLNEAAHKKLRGRQAAVVYIDCDLYSSTVLALDFVKPYLGNGTIVCFDDFYHYRGAPDQGEQRALSEFLQHNNGYTFVPWTDFAPVGKSFIARVSQAAH